MRLCYILNNLGNGGQERQLYYLLNELQHSDNEVCVVVWDYNDANFHSDRFKKLNIKIERFEIGKSSLAKAFLLRKFIRRYKPDVLHSYTFFLNFFCWLACLLTRSKAIGALRSQYQSHVRDAGKVTGFLCGFFPFTHISNNYRGAEELRKAFKIPFKKVYVITNKLNLEDFKYTVPSSELITVSIGRLTREKCLDKLIETIHVLREEYKVNVVHYHAGEGKLKPQLEALIGQYKLEGSFHLLGNVSDVNGLFAKSTLMIHTSMYEGMPNVIMEAFACGRAAVSTDCGDVPYLVKNGVNGYVTDVNDVKALAERSHLLLTDRNKCIEMGKNARAYAEAHFDVKKLVTETLGLYKKILS